MISEIKELAGKVVKTAEEIGDVVKLTFEDGSVFIGKNSLISLVRSQADLQKGTERMIIPERQKKRR